MLAVPKWLRGLTVNQLFGSSILLGQPKHCEHDSNDSNQAGRLGFPFGHDMATPFGRQLRAVCCSGGWEARNATFIRVMACW